MKHTQTKFSTDSPSSPSYRKSAEPPNSETPTKKKSIVPINALKHLTDNEDFQKLIVTAQEKGHNVTDKVYQLIKAAIGDGEMTTANDLFSEKINGFNP